MKQLIGVIAGTLLIGSACAQAAPPPLDLNVPAANAATFSNPSAPSATATKPTASMPGMYYGDTSGTVASRMDPHAQSACDDPNYNKAQVHGSVSATVVGGSHVSGTYNSGNVNLTQHYGNCDDPHGGVTLSIGASVGQGNIHTGRGRW